MADRSTRRITGEINRLKNGNDLSLAVAFRDENVRKLRALIIGPPETPYEFGFFEFDFRFSKRYPDVAPMVRLLTTNSGRTRFNPNLYNCGKVCLSILGTWQGESGEEWSPAQGLESVLISIQSLMSDNPYENEPGFEAVQGMPMHEVEAKAYSAKVHHETLRISVINRLECYLGINGAVRPQQNSELDKEDDIEDFEPFSDLCKTRFLWYYHKYLQRIDEALTNHGSTVAQGAQFTLTSFECGSNSMQGTFDYAKLKLRLQNINSSLKSEMEQWISDGAKARDDEMTSALEFRNRFERIVHDYKRKEKSVHFELVDENPFVWRVTLLGRPLTNLDGGIFNIKLVFHEKFPDVQPRVKVESPLFHQRVTPDGFLCYIPVNAMEISSHVQAIIDSIENESPPYDPRTLVHPEASRLFWGTPEDRKIYNRKVRKSVQESSG